MDKPQGFLGVDDYGMFWEGFEKIITAIDRLTERLADAKLLGGVTLDMHGMAIEDAIDRNTAQLERLEAVKRAGPVEEFKSLLHYRTTLDIELLAIRKEKEATK